MKQHDNSNKNNNKKIEISTTVDNKIKKKNTIIDTKLLTNQNLFTFDDDNLSNVNSDNNNKCYEDEKIILKNTIDEKTIIYSDSFNGFSSNSSSFEFKEYDNRNIQDTKNHNELQKESNFKLISINKRNDDLKLDSYNNLKILNSKKNNFIEGEHNKENDEKINMTSVKFNNKVNYSEILPVFIESSRNNSMLIYKDFIYNVTDNINNTKKFRCIKRSCKGRSVYKDDNTEETVEHNHPGNKSEAEKKIAMHNLKSYALNENECLDKIVSDIVDDLNDDVSILMPKLSTVKNELKKREISSIIF